MKTVGLEIKEKKDKEPEEETNKPEEETNKPEKEK